MAFGVYEDVSVACLSRSWFVYAPFLMGLAQPSPETFSARSILDSTVSCDVTERYTPLFPRLRADNEARDGVSLFQALR